MTSHPTGTSSPTTCPGRSASWYARAGHAGKFAALLGRILTELALDGSSRFPVGAFSAARPALTGATAVPTRVNSM
jgi:sarcosine oxidase